MITVPRLISKASTG